ncbi:unnamed protein product [Schistocephalus solidus]|uniref:Uncharacterized protein n=1 Tax=Schistocephalus solidus TaxID=70667 RepID=A0A183TPK1_SCHSO|nr:unnamed protein product [Schistocephalus solidus]
MLVGETRPKQLTAHPVVTSGENFGLIKREFVTRSRRWRRDLGVRVIPPQRCCMIGHSLAEYFEITTVFVANEDIQKGQLVVFFLLHRKLYFQEDAVETIFKCQHLIPLHDDEGVIHIPSSLNSVERDALRSARRWETFALLEASTYDLILVLASIRNSVERNALRSARRWETFALLEASAYDLIRFLPQQHASVMFFIQAPDKH